MCVCVCVCVLHYIQKFMFACNINPNYFTSFWMVLFCGVTNSTAKRKVISFNDIGLYQINRFRALSYFRCLNSHRFCSYFKRIFFCNTVHAILFKSEKSQISAVLIKCRHSRQVTFVIASRDPSEHALRPTVWDFPSELVHIPPHLRLSFSCLQNLRFN